MPKRDVDKVPPCPYCADPDLLDKILAPAEGNFQHYVTLRRYGSHWRAPHVVKRTVNQKGLARWGVIDPRVAVTLKEKVRGRYRIRTVTETDMIKRYAGFTIQVIGANVGERKPPTPSGPLLGLYRDHDTPFSTKQVYFSFEAARVTRADFALRVDYHWHPSHGRLVTMRGFSERTPTKGELEFIDAALGLDVAGKKRGAPRKVDPEAIVRAVREQGEAATQKSVAEATGTPPRTLRDWLYFDFGGTWATFKAEVIEGVNL